MIKKLAIAAVAFALAATPVLAVFTWPSTQNVGSVSNVVNTSANTGYNWSLGGRSHSMILTGGATSGAAVGTSVGVTGGFGNIYNVGNVSNAVNTSANTGYNLGGHGFIGTGPAWASSVVSTVVGTGIAGL